MNIGNASPEAIAALITAVTGLVTAITALIKIVQHQKDCPPK